MARDPLTVRVIRGLRIRSRVARRLWLLAILAAWLDAAGRILSFSPDSFGLLDQVQGPLRDRQDIGIHELVNHVLSLPHLCLKGQQLLLEKPLGAVMMRIILLLGQPVPLQPVRARRGSAPFPTTLSPELILEVRNALGELPVALGQLLHLPPDPLLEALLARSTTPSSQRDHPPTPPHPCRRDRSRCRSRRAREVSPEPFAGAPSPEL